MINIIIIMIIMITDTTLPSPTSSIYLPIITSRQYVATTGTTLAARIRLYGDSIHGLLYEKPVALSVPSQFGKRGQYRKIHFHKCV